MANDLLTWEAANLYAGAAPGDEANPNHLRITEIKLPGMDEQYVDHRPGGAPVAIEIDTGIARLECTFVLMGWSPQVAELIRSWVPVDNKFHAYGVVRNRQTGEASQAIAIMWGRLGRADPQNWRRGDPGHWNYAIRGITHYELKLVGQDEGVDLIYKWDFFDNTLIVGNSPNADRNIRVNQMLALNATTVVANPGGGFA